LLIAGLVPTTIADIRGQPAVFVPSSTRGGEVEVGGALSALGRRGDVAAAEARL